MAAALRLLAWPWLALRRLTRAVFRRLSPAGWALVAGVLACLGTANPEQTMGAPAALLLMAMLALAGLCSLRFRPRLALEREAPRLAAVGEPFLLRVRLRNLGRRVEAGLHYGEDLRDPSPFEQAVSELRCLLRRGGLVRDPRSRPVPLPSLPPGGATEAEVAVTAWRRGPLLLAGGLISRLDPLGLLRSFHRLRAPATVLVLPRRIPVPRFDLPGRSQHQQGGVALASGVGESEDFVSLRDYRRGDPLRKVHWRSAARTGRLVVKECQDEHFVRHALVLDTCCDEGAAERFEEAVALAASFACTIPDQESLLDLLFVSGERPVCVTSGRGVGHTQQMLEVLAAVRPGPRPALAALEALLVQHRPQLSGCVLLLLAWDAPRRALLRRLKSLRLPLLVLLLRPPGEAAPEPAEEERPERLVLLEEGRLEEGLRRLGGRP